MTARSRGYLSLGIMKHTATIEISGQSSYASWMKNCALAAFVLIPDGSAVIARVLYVFPTALSLPLAIKD